MSEIQPLSTSGYSVEIQGINEANYPDSLAEIKKEISQIFQLEVGQIDEDYATAPEAEGAKSAGFYVVLPGDKLKNSTGEYFTEARTTAAALRKRLQGQVEAVSINPIQNPYFDYDDGETPPTELEAGFLKAKFPNEVYKQPTWHKIRTKLLEARSTHNVSGEGVLIGHPDTGYTPHPELEDAPRGRIVIKSGTDFVEKADKNGPLDGMKRLRLLSFAGHGTGTASVIMSGKPGNMEGSAPEAKLLPLRVANTVALINDTHRQNLGDAFRKAVAEGCQVVSISMAGPSIGGDGLLDAARYAVENGVIICAAAGQLNARFRFVPNTFGLPAGYPFVVGVAATTPIFPPAGQDPPAKWSLRGPWINLSAPGFGIRRACWKSNKVKIGNERVEPSYGTSFAVAQVAGVVALWVERWSRNNGPLLQVQGADRTKLFMWVLNHCGMRWDNQSLTHEWGVGPLDAEKILNFDWTQNLDWQESHLELIPNFVGQYNRLEAFAIGLKNLFDLHYQGSQCRVPYDVVLEALSKHLSKKRDMDARKAEAEAKLNQSNLAMELMLQVAVSKRYRRNLLDKKLRPFIPDQYLGTCEFSVPQASPFEELETGATDEGKFYTLSAEAQLLL